MEDQEKPYTKYKSSRMRSRGPLKPEKPAPRESRPRPDREPERPEDRDFGRPPERPPGQRQDYSAGGGGFGAESGRRRGGWGRRIGILLLLLLVAALAVGGYFYWRLDRAVKESNARVPADVRSVLKKPAGSISSNPVNILFLGSDQRPDEPARADTILLVRADGRSKTVSQLSIPRDTLVDIPGYGEGKLNSAYSYGGPALMIQTVQELTGVPVHHYAELDFSGFPAIVDTLGGVDIDVPKAIDSQYPSGYDWIDVHFSPGPQHMTGIEALTYVRVRYSDDDFQRMGRQQQFMEALQRKFTSPSSMARMPRIAPEIIGNMTTDISTNDLLRLGWVKFRTPSDSNRKFVLEGVPEDFDGVSYVVMDEDESQAVIRQFLAS